MVQLVLNIAGVLAALFVKYSLAAEVNSVCKTPDGHDGDCISVTDCDEFVRVLNKVQWSSKEITFWQQSECGKRDGGKIFACCRYQPNKLLPDTKQCGKSLESRIYDGSVTDIGEYPWVALIETEYPNNTKIYQCSGSLINNRYVLTAGHCMRELKEGVKISAVRLGEWDTTTDPDCKVLRNGAKTCADPHLDVGIERIHVHPEYSRSIIGPGPIVSNDIALIRLDRNINFTDFIQPICLPVRPYQGTKNFDGIAMQVAGWGYTETGSWSPVKQKVTLTGIELKSCQKLVSKDQMCAGGESGKDSCKGDSGSPLMERQRVDNRDVYVLVGIVSFGGKDCGVQDSPGVYTRVGVFMKWIEKIL